MRKLLLLTALLPFATSAFAQPDARKAFDKLKALAGTWEGPVRTTPEVPEIDGTIMTVTLRVTSMGNVLMHEMTGVGRPDDPITMLYLESGQLELTHYCDAGNRPRMRGAFAPDGNSVTYDFIDLTGGNDHGHMHGAVFSFIDANHHIEEWTFMLPGGKAVRAKVDLRRK